MSREAANKEDRKDRNKNRHLLLDIVHLHNCRVGCEVGVSRGDHAEQILQRTSLDKLYLVDPWKQRYATPEEQYEAVQTRFIPYGDRVELRRGMSMQMAKTFPDEVFDFIYIDANHRYASVLLDLAAWMPKLRKDGILAGHDYVNYATKHIAVRAAVDEFLEGKHIYTTPDSRWPEWWVIV